MAKCPLFYGTPFFLISTTGLSGKGSEKTFKWTIGLVFSDATAFVRACSFGV